IKLRGPAPPGRVKGGRLFFSFDALLFGLLAQIGDGGGDGLIRRIGPHQAKRDFQCQRPAGAQGQDRQRNAEDGRRFELHRSSSPHFSLSTAFHFSHAPRTSRLGSRYIASSIGTSYSSSTPSARYSPSVSVASSRTSSDSCDKKPMI